MRVTFPLLALLGVAGFVSEPLATSAQEPSGTVELPLATYTQLVEGALPQPGAPAGYALGQAQVRVQVERSGSRVSAGVDVSLAVRVLEEEWVLVPVLPPATPVRQVQVGGSPVELVSSSAGLAWATKGAGAHTMTLSYTVDAQRSGAGFSLTLPLPRAAASRLEATIPGQGMDVAVVPGAGVSTSARGNATQVRATLPATQSVQLTWRLPSEERYVLSRASYRGRLAGGAVAWSAEIQVDLLVDETVTVPLFEPDVTLSRLLVDGRESPILDDLSISTLVSGRGRHTVLVGLEVPVTTYEGRPRIELLIPEVPISRFELTLPGRKEIEVEPSGRIETEVRRDSTVTTVHVPVTDQVTFTWTEGVPDELRAEVRTNAMLLHAAFAEEGLLSVQALAVYEITRGESNVLRLLVPEDVQVNHVGSSSGAVTDWRLGSVTQGNREVSVYLDRQLSGELAVEMFYDRPLPEAGKSVAVPLLRSSDAQRQRGMLALLSTRELSLRPVEEGGATRVGENQLPPFFRDLLGRPVAHTFKFAEVPQLTVEAAAPERHEGRFDARVDTLVSLGEVTVHGTVTVELNVKSGSLETLQLSLPDGVTLLNLTGPSLRTHRVAPQAADGRRTIDVEFTQEMEGQFRLQLGYEEILVDGDAELVVPTLWVVGAEIEEGRIGVEALSAVEVQAGMVEQLTVLDPNQLPRQLILQTTNPILMAYKYIQSDPPPRLGLRLTRHRLLEVQEAAIDQAHYRTLVTRDGLNVTTADFRLRNSRQQFLRLDLPREAEVWSAFVDGKPEKPAAATGEGENGGSEHTVLLKIIHSTEGFPVRLIYSTQGGRVAGLGSVGGSLPHPGILVTRTRWDLYLPAGLRYGEPKTNMELEAAAVPVAATELAAQRQGVEAAEARELRREPLRLDVPAAGVRYSFEKLYANQSRERASAEIPYASERGATVGAGLVFFFSLLFWAGAALVWSRPRAVGLRLAAGIATTGLLLLLVTLALYPVSPVPAIAVSIVVVLAAVAYFGRGPGQRWWEERRSAKKSPVAEAVEVGESGEADSEDEG